MNVLVSKKHYVLCGAYINLNEMALILEKIKHLSFDQRQTIAVRKDTLTKINKIIGAAMYRNSEKVSKSDIIAHAVDHLYASVLRELPKAKKQ